MADEYISESQDRNPFKWLFYTFPKCGEVTRQDIVDVLASQYQTDFYCVSAETHKDGTPHLHALINYRKPISKAKILKILKNKYPNDWKRQQFGRIRKNSTPWHAHQYILKEDPDPITYGSSPQRPKCVGTNTDRLANGLGFDSIEALQRHVDRRRSRYREIDTKIIQCIRNIEEYSLLYDIELPMYARNIIDLFTANPEYNLDFSFSLFNSGINLDDEADAYNVQKFIKNYYYPSFIL